jgi:hypothetical protein
MIASSSSSDTLRPPCPSLVRLLARGIGRRQLVGLAFVGHAAPPFMRRSIDSASFAWPLFSMWAYKPSVVLMSECPSACRRSQGRATCEFRFPALEAQQGGEWTLHLLKRSSRPATVTVVETFEAV